MKRAYADLHLLPNPRDLEQVSRIVSKALELGYKFVGIPLPQNFQQEEIQKLKSLCAESGIDFVSRVDLKPRSPKELIRDLRKLRRKFELVAVLCTSKSVARQAAKDRRVDLLNFPVTDFRKRFFDRAEAELASNALASLEIDVKPLLTLEGLARARFIQNLRGEATTAIEYGVPIVVSSGVADEKLMRKPMEQASLTFLFDLDEATALKTVSKNPIAIMKRNREKLSPKFIAPGIRVIRRGKDC
ncbi:MAG: RNase P subunit p30 family protein [Candidatus Bathyarchaeales archaeon]